MYDEATSDLARSGISAEQAKSAGMYPIANAQDIFPEYDALPALVIPYYDPTTMEQMTFTRDGEKHGFARLRYLKEPVKKVTFAHKKVRRYAQPVDSGVYPYFPLNTGVDWPAVLNGDVPILITEGEKKATAGCLAGVPCIGLGGVYNFMSEGALLPALDRISWKKRSVYICFDSDAADNPQIQAAEGRLAAELSQKRGANVYLVRLPDGAGGSKVGIDDFLVDYGRDAFIDKLVSTPQVRKVDAAVLSLNEHVCWIEEEAKVYDLTADHFMPKEAFTNGSRYSAIKIIQPVLKGKGTKEVSVAQKWLTHPHAQRYTDVIFDPTTTSATVPHKSGGMSLNMWSGWEPMQGDVQPFLDLNEFLFSTLPGDLRDFAFKLMIYNFQNPGIKVPIAPVLIGLQGCGKTLWASIVRDAAGVHGVDIPSDALLSDYNGWIEKSLIAVFNEAKPEHVSRGSERLRGLISEDTGYLNEKYRIARQVKTYTSYILTANDRRVGSYDADDRRMFVVDTARPHKDGADFYMPIVKWWKEQNGPAKLLNYMLTYDLQGWTPPTRAPLTTEKYMARMENATPIERLAEEMQTADSNTVAMWINAAMISARVSETSSDQQLAARAREVMQSLGRIQVRPFYTPEELAAIFPMIAEQFYSNKRMRGTPSGEISRKLRENGIRYLVNKDDPRGFKKAGRIVQYLVIADPDDWPREMSQNELERNLQNFPSYAQWAQARGPK